MLAAKWLKAINKTYKDKGLGSFQFAENIVTAQAKEFSAAVDKQFAQQIDFDTPDYKMREILKQNTWHFSIAKNHNDLKALNNLLLKEDGSLRTWSEFKREAQKVVGTSIKYLKTEYNTIVAGAQMGSLWAEIQRDKHIFPFLEFVVTKDNHTSEICEPLYKVVVSVDDPMLLQYFPPNHFNCRTTVKKLRRGVPTKNYNAPDIPDAFKNNIGITGKLFSDKNEYIKNTPQEISDEAYKKVRSKLIETAKTKLIGKEVLREDVFQNNLPIIFYPKGIKDAINNPLFPRELYYIKNKLVHQMDEVLKEAEYLGFNTFKGDATIKGSHIFKIVVDKEDLFIIVREWITGEKRFYSITNKKRVIENLKK